ncbi:MAG: hypothetical protein U9Q90_03440 [Campylobacterota bacterium]|nr:hypothetical protein [Campylobacterota bacterium]
MQSKLSIKLFFLFILLTLNVFAIEGKVKVFIKSQESIYTSQKATVSVELLSNAFSITDAKITFPSSKKYIVQVPKSASYLGHDEVNSEEWQMVHYDYEIYALQAGRIEIPSVLVSFTASMGYGQPKKEFELQSDTLSFDVKAPKGVKPDQFVLVTDKFMLHSELKPQKKKLIVGDAVELSVTQKANGAPDILLSPVRYDSNAYLRVYSKEPELKSGLKGEYDVSRTDSFTFVASAEGNVTLPVHERLWYNSVTQKIHVEKSPEMTFEILPDPQIAIDAKKARQKQLLLYVIITLLSLLIFYKIFGSKVRSYREERRRMHEQSEEGLYKRVLDASQGSNLPVLYQDFYKWLEAADPELARSGFRGVSDTYPSLSDSLLELERGLADPNQPFDRQGFMDQLGKFREELLERNQLRRGGLPKTINPI